MARGAASISGHSHLCKNGGGPLLASFPGAQRKQTNKQKTNEETNKQTKNGRAQHGFVEQTEVCLDVTTPEIQ